MKKLSLFIFLILMWSNVGFAEMYACSAELSRFNRPGEVQTSIFTRKGNFFYNDLNWKFKIHKETNDEIHLVATSNVPSIYAVIVNKKTNEFAENYLSIESYKKNKSKPLLFGKCVKG